MSRLEALVLLNMVEGVDGALFKKILEVFASFSDVFDADVSVLCDRLGISGLLARRIVQAPSRLNASLEIEIARRKNIRIVTFFDEEYPQNLKEIYDPPFVLYVKGRFLASDINAMAVVGSRLASFYGLSCARHFASALAASGLTIVSGMARGIDTAAHRAALAAGGRTIAVLGGGFHHLYPPENERLSCQISEAGVVVTEFALDRPPLPQHFPMRNRIVSGLAKGVLVVEAAQRSGALITARCALEQNREVFAIPGNRTSKTSAGTNDLIKQGARLVTEPREILEDLRFLFSWPSRRLSAPRFPADGESAGGSAVRVLRELEAAPKYVDVISQATGLAAQQTLSILLELELKGLVKQLPGKMFVRDSFLTEES